MKFLLMLIFSSLPQLLYADSMVELGAHIGGDEVIVKSYEDGRRDSIKAGERFSFGLGRLYHHGDGWETQLMFGVKSDAKFDNELEVSWVRFPLNGLVFYRMQSTRIGLGATIHFSPKLKGTGVASGISEEFETAYGGLLELGFIRSERFLWGIRLTFIDYESKANGRVLDGNSIGFLMIGQL